MLEEGFQGENKKMLDVIMDCSNNLLDLVNDVLELSKIEAGLVQIEPSSVNLHDLIDSVLEIVRNKARDKNLELMVSMGPNTPAIVELDIHKVKRVLINLAGNAIKVKESH